MRDGSAESRVRPRRRIHDYTSRSPAAITFDAPANTKQEEKLEISTSVIGSDALIVAHLETVEDPGNVVMMLPITYTKDMCALVVWQRINELT